MALARRCSFILQERPRLGGVVSFCSMTGFAANGGRATGAATHISPIAEPPERRSEQQNGPPKRAVRWPKHPQLVGVYVVGLGVCRPTFFVHDPHAPGFLVRVALGWVLDVDRVDDPVSPATIGDGAPALRTVGNRQVVTHGASLARFFPTVSWPLAAQPSLRTRCSRASRTCASERALRISASGSSLSSPNSAMMWR
jgi:hypothetical protein